MKENEILNKTIELIEKSGGNTLKVDSYVGALSWNGSLVHVIERSILILDDSTPMVFFVFEEKNVLRLATDKEYQALIPEYNKKY